MKISLFCNCRYLGPTSGEGWPVPAADFSPELAQASYETTLNQAEIADQLGWDWVSVAEHHFAPFSISPNPMVMAAAFSQRVKTAKIALMGPDTPILNPVRVAEEFAMLDNLTGGRIVAGLMRGTPNEYVTYNVNPNESRGRFEESLKLIRMIWTEKQPFGWQGRYFQFRTISIWPRPVQEPHPALFMSGSSMESGKFAAKNKVGVGFAVTTLEAASKAAAYYREEAGKADWEPAKDNVVYRMPFYLADTDDQAVEDLKVAGASKFKGIGILNPDMMRVLRQTKYFSDSENRDREAQQATNELKDRIKLGQLLIGSPDTVIKQIEKIRDDLGPGILDLANAGQMGDKTTKSMELMATKVLPHIKDW